jgi:hypothetical protein
MTRSTADLAEVKKKLRGLIVNHTNQRALPPLALPTLPRLTARLSLAQPLTRTDLLRRATFDPDWRR